LIGVVIHGKDSQQNGREAKKNSGGGNERQLNAETKKKSYQKKEFLPDFCPHLPPNNLLISRSL
jgi:hypothetical protein